MPYIVTILLPIAAGIALLMGAVKSVRAVKLYTGAFVLVTAALAVGFALSGREGMTAVSFTEGLTLAFACDGLSRVFALIVSLLWVATSFYAFEYMKHEGSERRFFGFFLMSFGVVLGIAFAKNLFTLYIFYEYLTFSTLPLVMHAMDGKARYAARKYLLYMVTGGGLAFVAMLMLLRFGSTLDFTPGGVLSAVSAAWHEDALRVAFLLGLAGFGVKAAIFPLHGWLPSASVAPTPVTALLHAVAVVKSGVFAIIRLSYYGFGADFLRGSYDQAVMIAAACFTIVFGSVMALREPHLKRRLAYSTVSNLSYIILGAALLSPRGLTGAVLHLMLHAAVKIVLFFCAGAILYKTGIEYMDDLKGLARRMPLSCALFTICSLSLIGVPPLAAFQSKYLIATAAAAMGGPLSYLGVSCLILSEVLTAIYLFMPIINFYHAPALGGAEIKASDPNGLMSVPMCAVTAASVLLTAFAGPVADWLLRAL